VAPTHPTCLRCRLSTQQHTIMRYVNSSDRFPLSFHTGGQTPACLYLAPNLAVRFGIIPILSGFPSYLIRVWPGRQGHHVVYTGFPVLDTGSQKLARCLPAHLMFNTRLLSSYLYQLWRSIISLILHHGKCQTKQPVKCCPDYFPSIERVGMGRPLSPLLGPGAKISIESQHRNNRRPCAVS
jgi:hypothetical protein